MFQLERNISVLMATTSITNDDERKQALAPLTSQIAMMSKRAQVIGNVELGNEE